MKSNKLNLHQQALSRIFRSTTTQSNWQHQDKLYAKCQLRKIYSQQLSKVLSSNKYYFLWDKNRSQIDQKIQIHNINKLQKMHTLQQKSVERRDKLIKDRIKLYKINDKQWVNKKEQIKSMVRNREQSMREAARACRLKTQTEWKQRQSQTRDFMQQFSQKYHQLYNSNSQTPRSIGYSSAHSFNQSKYEQLISRRKSKLKAQTRSSKDKDQIARKHQEREKSLSEQKQKETVSGIVRKLSKMEEIQIKRRAQHKKNFLQKAKQKLNGKVYGNNKPQIGQNCKKHDLHESKFRVKTLTNQRTTSPIRATPSRSSMVSQDLARDKKEQSLMKYYQKTRHGKISKLLKMSIRNLLTTQFHKAHASSLTCN